MNLVRTVQIRRLFRIVNGGTPTSDVENWDGGILWATPVDLGRANGRTLARTDRTLSEIGLRAGSSAVPAGSLVISTRAPIGYVAETTTRTAFNQGCRGLVPVQDVDIRFYLYAIASMTERLQAAGQGSTFAELSTDTLAQQQLPASPIPIQRAIADYLDAETARIDALIAKKRRMIDLLSERRQSVVDHLTLSERYVPLQRVAELLPGFAFASDDFGPQFDGPRLLRGINVGVGTLRWDDEARLHSGSAAPKRYLLREHDIVVGMDRPFIADGTRVALVDQESAGALLVQRVCRIRLPSPAFATVVAAVLSSQRFMAHVQPDLTGVSVPHLSDRQIGSFPIPALPASELEAIAARLTREFIKSEATRARVATQVALLQEHRQALITAAVTGELEVPGVAA